MSSKATIKIEIDRPVYEQTASHMVDLVNDVLEPFAARVTDASFETVEVEKGTLPTARAEILET